MSSTKLKAQVRVSAGRRAQPSAFRRRRENFPAVMELVAEVLREPSFPESEFETLKQQQITMLEAERSEPQAIALQNAERIINPYPKGDVRYVPTLDEEIAEIKAVKLDDVKSFYKKFYGASRAEFAAVGDLDAESLRKADRRSVRRLEEQRTLRTGGLELQGCSGGEPAV